MNIPKSYELIKKEHIEEICADTYLLKHVKNGARVLVVDCDDNNKVFGIGFRTPVSDSTGVPHILEHSVLCGSERFPVQDPFMELAKSSPNTFLNAMTYPDKTIYPVASCNMKDLKNLMAVYMDAVFKPNIYNEEKIFKQEGWHYEMPTKEDDLTISGVVYSEMKGVFSDPEDTLDRFCQNTLYPDTGYAFESGGDPAVIPTLTYENFIDFHRRYYHPSNSYIYLYGDMDHEERLEWIDKEYLSSYDRLEIDSHIKMQEAFSTENECRIFYPVSSKEDENGKTWLSKQWSVGTMQDENLHFAMQVLEFVLIGMEGAPLKEALINSELGEDVIGGYQDEILQPFFKITLKNSSVEKKQEFLDILDATLRKIVKEGLNEKSILAGINSLEFRTREADFGGYPKGLVYYDLALSTWLYDENEPTKLFKYNKIFEFLKNHTGDGYFEDLIRKYFIENKHASVVVLCPKEGLDVQRDRAESDRLAAIKSSLTDEQIDEIVKNAKELKIYQSTPDSEEALATLPHLELEDVENNIHDYGEKFVKIDNKDILYEEYATNNITYLNMLYDVSDLSDAEIADLTVLRDVLVMLSTKKYSYAELSTEVMLQLGNLDMGIDIWTNLYPERKGMGIGTGINTSTFTINAKFLHNKQSEALSLIEEILHNTCFDDTKRLLTVVKQIRTRNNMRAMSLLYKLAVDKASSNVDLSCAFAENISGITAIKRLNKLADLIDSDKNQLAQLAERLKKLAEKVFDNSRLFINVCDDAEGLSTLKDAIRMFADKPYVGRDFAFTAKLSPKKEAYKTTSQVNYVSIVGKPSEEYTYSSSIEVVRILLLRGFLWNELRVKGGAYGTMCGFTLKGRGYFVSYRDPNLMATLETYKKIPDYLENFTCDNRRLTDLIISLIGSQNQPLTPSIWGNLALGSFIAATNVSDRKKNSEEAIATTVEKIRSFAPYFRELIAQGNICVCGNASDIDAVSDEFDKVEVLL